MGTKTAKVIHLSEVRALRSTVEALHAPEMQAVIFDGALSEFKRLISPLLRDLLEAKGASPVFQQEVIALLERTYALQHVDKADAAK